MVGRGLGLLVLLSGCIDWPPLAFERTPEFVRIEAGSIEIDGAGTPVGPLLMGRTEVTRGQWFAVFGAGPECELEFALPGCGCDTAPCGDKPAVGMNWYHVIYYCNARSRLEGRPSCYQGAEGSYGLRDAVAGRSPRVVVPCAGYRLPRSSEWSFAARADGGLGVASAEHGCFGDAPCRVGSFSPNGLGLFDLVGNVWEWTEDPAEEGGLVVRGCSFRDERETCLASSRSTRPESARSDDLGFRVVRGAD